MDAPRRNTHRLIGAAVIAIAAVACSSTTTAEPARNTIELDLVVDTTTTVPSTTTTVAAVVAPTTTAPPSVTAVTTTAAAPDGCWIDLARQVGWPESTLGHLSYIINRESKCDPTAFADRPSTLDNSRGLLQINAYGNLGDHIRRVCGVEPDALFDPATNLACGLVYWQRSGFAPWGG